MLAIDVQPQAGVQDGDAGLPRPGHISGYSMAVQSIDLAVPGSNPPALDSTVMLYDANTGSLGLSAPRSAQNVTAGCFQIETAIFTSPPDYFNIGSAVYVNDGVVLSSFVAARPRLVFEIQPVLKFYVANGNKEIGSVIKVDDYIAFSASCDFTAGYSSADVAYQPDGSWNVVMA